MGKEDPPPDLQEIFIMQLFFVSPGITEKRGRGSGGGKHLQMPGWSCGMLRLKPALTNKKRL
jgi:hypothetical protein